MDLAQRHGKGCCGEELLRGLVPEPVPGKRRKHFTTNIIIELAADSATVVSNFLVVRDSDAGPVISVAGTYDDVVARTAEGWKFKSRKLSPILRAKAD